jgi:hypothetical protein
MAHTQSMHQSKCNATSETWNAKQFVGAGMLLTFSEMMMILELSLKYSSIAAPRLRPLFKDKQIVEGSDGCGLFVDNLIFLKIVLFCVFYRVSIGLRCFNLRIMNPDLSGLRLISFLFQCVNVATTIFFPPKKVTKASIFSQNCFLFFIVLPEAKISL